MDLEISSTSVDPVCGALSHKMDELILRKHQVDGTKLYIHGYFLPYFHQNKMIKFLGSLLQCIGQNFYTNFIEIYFLVCVFIIQLFILRYFNDLYLAL